MICRIENNVFLYLLLRYPALSHRAKKDYCDFPKGHVEKGEKDIETVRREVKEETGIDDLEFVGGFKETIKYFFIADKKKIFKVVTFYLAKTQKNEVKISAEHSGFAWLPLEEALKELSFANARAILKKADKTLKDISMNNE